MKKLMAMLIVLMLVFSSTGALAEKLMVGTNAEFPPFEYIGDDGTIQGFDAELIGAILTKLGYEYEIISIEFDALITSLETEQINIAIAGMTISEERKQQVLFSDPYFDATQKIIVPDGSPIKGEKDLVEGLKVGVQMGTTGDMYVTDNLPVTCERYNKALDAVLDLKAGRVHAVMVDAAPSEYFAKSVGGVVVLDEKISDEQYGIAMKKDKIELVEKINKALAELVQDGAYDEIYNKYFGSKEQK